VEIEKRRMLVVTILQVNLKESNQRKEKKRKKKRRNNGKKVKICKREIKKVSRSRIKKKTSPFVLYIELKNQEYKNAK
jgi:hypothetical protein